MGPGSRGHCTCWWDRDSDKDNKTKNIYSFEVTVRLSNSQFPSLLFPIHPANYPTGILIYNIYIIVVLGQLPFCLGNEPLFLNFPFFLCESVKTGCSRKGRRNSEDPRPHWKQGRPCPILYLPCPSPVGFDAIVWLRNLWSFLFETETVIRDDQNSPFVLRVFWGFFSLFTKYAFFRKIYI